MTELNPLLIASQHIRALAALQNDVAEGIGYATVTVDRVGERVTTSHGSICSGTANAVKDAETERRLAASGTQAASDDLANKLEHAAGIYDEIDREEQAKLNEQMRQGG